MVYLYSLINLETSMRLVYKIVPTILWQRALNSGYFYGSDLDIQDGFIHLSSFEQVRETAQKHFKAPNDLMIFAIKDLYLAPDLKWEVSRNNELFPHFYGRVDLKMLHFVKPLPFDLNGNHLFPDLLNA